MALSITDLKKGAVFQQDDTPYKVIEYAQKVKGRGGSIVNVKVRNLVDGKISSKTFKGNEQLEHADVTSRDGQFLYTDASKSYFMDKDNFEQYEVENSLLGEQINFLKEGQEVQIQLFEQRVIGIEMPKNVYLKVAHAEHAVKGDTSSALTKNATLETGAEVKVPAFIKTGDVISVSTDSGEYKERKKN